LLKIRRRRTPRIAIERSETYLNGIETKNGVSNADNSGINSKGNLLNAEAVKAVADKADREEGVRAAKEEEVVVEAKVAVEGVAVWVGM